MNVEFFIHDIEDPKGRTLAQAWYDHLRSLIPQGHWEMKFSHMPTPFFMYLGWFCYFNCRKDFLEVGFTKGHELSNAQGLLLGQHLKQVRHLRISSLEELQSDAVAEIILEAAALHEQSAKNKVNKKTGNKTGR